MKKHRVGIIALALAGLLLLVGATYWLQRAEPATLRGDSAQAQDVTVVETARVLSVRFPAEASAVGTLKSNESVLLRPETSGRIEAIYFKDGERVKRGALLLALDAGVQAAELQQARANLALAQANQRRNEDLFQKKFISQQALDNTRAALKVQEAAVALAQARVDKMRIRAPFDGVVGIRNVSVGDYVKEGEDLVNLEDTAILKVDFRLPEVHLNRLRVGQTLEVRSDALPDETFSARLAAIDPLVDVGGRSISCRALLSNQEGHLHPGMFVRVQLAFGERDTVLAIPEEAVVMGSTPSVFRVQNGRAKTASVQLGQHRDGQVEVLEGLQAGDIVVTSGQLKLRDDQPVRYGETHDVL
ncbi:MAG: efflux RND transporter periplasmic adaptor subunit [Zoogloeaceae bacterium]|nr:efflux RND transporter periplasmic adaptor subunit [Zoogloeaceae bacterium]